MPAAASAATADASSTRPPSAATGAEPASTQAFKLEQSILEPAAKMSFEFGGGGCERTYAHGGKGTCINNAPCNGFGFRDSSGNLQCACFKVAGGCSEDSACDVRRYACVQRVDLQRSPVR